MIRESVYVSGPNLFPPLATLELENGVAYRTSFSEAGAPLIPIEKYDWRKTGPATGILSGDGGTATTITFSSPLVGSFREFLTTVGVTFRPFPVAPRLPPIRNGSTRLTLAAGQTAMMGFVVGGLTPRRILVRAIGPSLAQFGVANPVANPVLTIFRGSTLLATNSGWGGMTATAAVFDAVRAFALSASSRDCALVLVVPAGGYTAQVSAATAGEVLLEVYFVD